MVVSPLLVTVILGGLDAAGVVVPRGCWRATAPPLELEASTRLSRSRPVWVPVTARRVWAPDARWIGRAEPPAGLHASTWSAAPLTAAAVSPLMQTGSGRPAMVRRSD